MRLAIILLVREIRRLSMKTVQMTLDDSLVDDVDRAVKSMGTTRSAFTRDALRAALMNMKERDLERRHRAGYERNPVEPGEFSDWEDEQVWGD
jgi:Arc/MetJ-type ribon-helix-helix transcriptional regulator